LTLTSVNRALSVLFSFFFFFQAEDGIRDLTVTGVQTCALPISQAAARAFRRRTARVAPARVPGRGAAPAPQADRRERSRRDHDARSGRHLADTHRRQGAVAKSAHPAGESRGPVSRAHRQGAARMMQRLLSVWHARNLE